MTTRTSQFQRLIDSTRNLYYRELKSRYASSVLGPLWIVLYPLTFTSIVTAVFSQFFTHNTFEVPYYLFVLTGFIIWNFFSQTIVQMAHGVLAQRALLKNTTIPQLAIPLSQLFVRLTDFVILYAVLLIISTSQGYLHLSSQLLLLPLLVILQSMFQVGMGLIVVIAAARVRDFVYVTELAIQLLFYASPVVYELAIAPSTIRALLLHNPIYAFLELHRAIIFTGTSEIGLLLIVIGWSVASLGIGLTIFNHYKHALAEVL